MAKSLPAAWYLSFPTVSWFRVQPPMTRTNSEVALQTETMYKELSRITTDLVYHIVMEPRPTHYSLCTRKEITNL